MTIKSFGFHKTQLPGFIRPKLDNLFFIDMQNSVISFPLFLNFRKDKLVMVIIETEEVSLQVYKMKLSLDYG